MNKRQIENALKSIKKNLGILNTYFKIYREECKIHPTTMSPATDILGKEGIDIIIGTIEKTKSSYFMEEEQKTLREYTVEIYKFIKKIQNARPDGADEPVYEKEGVKRLYAKSGNTLIEGLREIVQGAWAMLPK